MQITKIKKEPNHTTRSEKIISFLTVTFYVSLATGFLSIITYFFHWQFMSRINNIIAMATLTTLLVIINNADAGYNKSNKESE